MLKLLEFIKTHDNWEELLVAAPYCLKISRDDGYILFKYNQLESDFMNPIVRECRGLILRESGMSPVCVPFYKFGNYGEEYCPDIDWQSASVQQKIDGSLIKLWSDGGKWRVSTNGTIDAFKADLASIYHKSFGELFMAALSRYIEVGAALDSYLDSRFTYLFELVSPENRVVIPYEELDLYFLGVRNNVTLQEYMPEQTKLFNYNLFKIPTRYNLHSLKDVQAAASILPWDEEGYVVCDKYFNRVKIKSPEYVKAHFIRNNSAITYEHLLEIILAGEQAEFLIYALDYKNALEKVEAAYTALLQEVFDTIKELDPESFETRKDYAMAVLSEKTYLQPFLFKYNNLDNFIKTIRPAKWIEYLRQRGDLD